MIDKLDITRPNVHFDGKNDKDELLRETRAKVNELIDMLSNVNIVEGLVLNGNKIEAVELCGTAIGATATMQRKRGRPRKNG